MNNDMRREPRWVVEVMNIDGGVDQRLALCDSCISEIIDEMRAGYPQAENGAYSVVRRMMNTDSIVSFDTFSNAENQ